MITSKTNPKIKNVVKLQKSSERREQNRIIIEGRREIERALDTLTTREKEIIKMFFGLGEPEKTLEEIGDRFNLTRERVRQIKEKAIRRLRTQSKSRLLKTYLG